jgi:hypothetical protein
LLRSLMKTARQRLHARTVLYVRKQLLAAERMVLWFCYGIPVLKAAVAVFVVEYVA